MQTYYVQVMKPRLKGGRGTSTNREACYDKWDKATVALSRLDDGTQSILLCLHLDRDSVTSLQSRFWRSNTPHPQSHTSLHPHLSQAPSPTSISIKGLAWSVDRWRGKCDLKKKKLEKKGKKCKKAAKCKRKDNSTQFKCWWKHAIIEQKACFTLWFCTFYGDKLWETENCCTVFLELHVFLTMFLCVFLFFDRLSVAGSGGERGDCIRGVKANKGWEQRRGPQVCSLLT